MRWDPSLAIIIRIPQNKKSGQESLSSNAPPVLSQDETQSPDTNTSQAVVVTPEPAPDMWVEPDEESTFPVGFFLISILIYLVAVGPLDYFLTRLFRRPWLTWVTLPIWAILFTTLFYHAGRFLDLENPEKIRFHQEEIIVAEPPPPPPPENPQAPPSEVELNKTENE